MTQMHKQGSVSYNSPPLLVSAKSRYCHIYQYLRMSCTKFEQNIFMRLRKIKLKWSAIGAIFKHTIIGENHYISISPFFKTVLFSSKYRYLHQISCVVFFQPYSSHILSWKSSIRFHRIYMIFPQQARKG